MVGAAVSGGARTFNIRRLLHLGGFPRAALPLWAVSLAFLFSGTFWIVAAQLVRWQTRLVAWLVDLFSGFVDSLGAGRISPHLLLLPRRVLQSVLGRSALLHSR